METKLKPGFQTCCIHEGYETGEHKSHLTPIYASSTYLLGTAEEGAEIFTGERKGYVYGRFGNPTIEQCENKLAALESYNLSDEKGNPLKLKALLHSSGMGAISTLLLSNLEKGDKLLTHYSLYGGTQEYLDKVIRRTDIDVEITDMKDMRTVEEKLASDSRIKMLYLETPANPTLQCVDIEELTNIAKKYRVKVACDNTFATPALQQPFRYGVDFVVHSTTKFLNGHGTAVGGVLLGKDTDFFNTKVIKHHRLLGANSNAFEAFLLTNGLKTLGLRMEKHGENAEKVAHFLENHPAVEKVNYLGLLSHTDFELCKKQMKHPGALMSLLLKGGFEAGKTLINHLQLLTHAVSLGTTDTLISHPASTTHFGVRKELRELSGISDGLIRISVGLENVEDIIADLKQSLDKCMI